MKTLKSFWKNKIASFFKPSTNSEEKFDFGIGKSMIKENSIKIWNYPFEPASVYPSKEIQSEEIEAIHLENYPPTLKVDKELIFISRASVNQLKEFAKRNGIKLAERPSNWDYITEPFLDTEFDDNEKEATLKSLIKNGFTKKEITEIRKEIGDQMYKYNFDTMLWEWVHLGLSDVLAALKPKLNKKDFEEIYWRAMEIEQRKSI